MWEREEAGRGERDAVSGTRDAMVSKQCEIALSALSHCNDSDIAIPA